MNMKLNFLILLATLLTASSFEATSDDSNGPTLGLGNHSCGQYIKALDDYEKAKKSDEDREFYMAFMFKVSYEHWSDGYLSAIRVYAFATADAQLRVPDIDARRLWLKNYCNDNPLESFSTANAQLLAAAQK